jgi:hypothetical protein
MIDFRINSDEGVLRLGSLQLSWGNQLDSYWEILPGFFSITYNCRSIEFGEVDQGQPGIYLTTWRDDDISSSKAILTFGSKLP